MSIKISAAAVAVVIAVGANAAYAAQSVTINGRTHTCTNQCVVTTKPNGDYTVTDSEGGRVRVSYPTNQQQ
jgi:hypothetical protein